jgi:hypothetical protein
MQMSLTTTAPAAAAPPITCVLYAAVSGGPRCQHYRGAGVCGVHGKLLEECSEWRKINPALATPTVVLEQRGGEQRQRAPGPSPFEGDAACVSPDPAGAAQALATPMSRVLTAEDIATFKALGAEVCITCEAGELWIVPEYRDATRREMSVEHVAKILLLTSAFPGAKVRAVVPVPPEAA